MYFFVGVQMCKTVAGRTQRSVNLDVDVMQMADMKMNDGNEEMLHYVFNGILMVMTSQ